MAHFKRKKRTEGLLASRLNVQEIFIKLLYFLSLYPYQRHVQWHLLIKSFHKNIFKTCILTEGTNECLSGTEEQSIFTVAMRFQAEPLRWPPPGNQRLGHSLKRVIQSVLLQPIDDNFIITTSVGLTSLKKIWCVTKNLRDINAQTYQQLCIK